MAITSPSRFFALASLVSLVSTIGDSMVPLSSIKFFSKTLSLAGGRATTGTMDGAAIVVVIVVLPLRERYSFSVVYVSSWTVRWFPRR